MNNEIYFANAGEIDLDLIRILGISVKDKESPIGYFGTGLKHAIAILLRTDHKVELTIGGHKAHYEFTARDKVARGKPYKQVFMNDEPLGFTTDFGKDWEVWEAYRELHSNTLDECGTISDKPLKGDTVFKITGSGTTREYHNRAQIFITEKKPIAANEFLEVYDGETKYIYYRGVRAGATKGTKFGYNILQETTLNEQRKFDSLWDVEYKLCTLIPTLSHKGFFTELLDGNEFWDQNLNLSYCGSPKQEFIEVAAAQSSNVNLNSSVRKMIERDTQNKGSFPLAKLSDKEQSIFLQCFETLQKMDCTLSPEDVLIAETLGPDIMGVYHAAKDQIFLAKSTLDWGEEVIIATLFEEWLHKVYKYKDCTRSLQNYLFQRLVALTMDKEIPEPKKGG